MRESHGELRDEDFPWLCRAETVHPKSVVRLWFDCAFLSADCFPSRRRRSGLRRDVTGSNLPTETRKQTEEHLKDGCIQALRSNDRFGVIYAAGCGVRAEDENMSDYPGMGY